MLPLSHKLPYPCVSFLQGTIPTCHYEPGTGGGTEEFFDTKIKGPCHQEYHGLVGNKCMKSSQLCKT